VQPLTHTHIHTLSHTHSLSLSLSLTHTHTHIHTRLECRVDPRSRVCRRLARLSSGGSFWSRFLRSTSTCKCVKHQVLRMRCVKYQVLRISQVCKVLSVEDAVCKTSSVEDAEALGARQLGRQFLEPVFAHHQHLVTSKVSTGASKSVYQPRPRTVAFKKT